MLRIRLGTLSGSEVKQGSSFSVLIPMLVDPVSNQEVTNTNMDQDKPNVRARNPRSRSSKLLLVIDNVRNLYALTAALQVFNLILRQPPPAFKHLITLKTTVMLTSS